MTRQGIVESVSDGKITVLLSDASCDGCSTPCGACNRKRAPQRAVVENTLSASVGERVELFCSSAVIVLYCLALFLLPILTGVGLCVFWIPAMGEGRAALFAALCALGVFSAFACLFSLPYFKRKNAFSLARVYRIQDAEKELDKP